MYFTCDNLVLRNDPFPIGLAKPLMDEATYDSLSAAYPPLELFQHIPQVGHKYCLSQKFHGPQYQEFIASHGVWRDFHAWIKSDDFTYGIMRALEERWIDLGFDRPVTWSRRVLKALRNLARGRLEGPEYLTARFEFSMLPAAGGYVTPHTDESGKLVTLVISMMREGEWNPAFGGGTDINRPKDLSRNFNRKNAKAEFDEMEILDTFEFTPNQAVLFVRTFNSWHSVRPMTGNDSSAMRKTLTINIEVSR
jgi:hypothetical protein